MNKSLSGPYRATALWNEAVLMFRNGMPVGENRHRLHKHRDSFTGHAAVSFLHNALRNNQMFDPEVTREQTAQLLKQFLKSDLITSVQNCSRRNKNSFHDSYKYLYEFTDKLKHFQPLIPVSSRFPEKRKSTLLSEQQKENNLLLNSEKSWKLAIIRRIIELLRPFEVIPYINFEEINPKWVATNADPQWSMIKWNSELPPWILSAMQQLLKYSSRDHCGNVYPEFHLDAFKLISDYFKTLENPIILQCFYKLFVKIFNYIDYLNNQSSKKTVNKMSSSQEDLMNKISSPIKKKMGKNVALPKKRLPPNLCYEAAFVSDDPTFRVVPQSSVDTVHLSKGNLSHPQIFDDSLGDSRSTSLKEISNCGNFKPKKNKKKPLKYLENFKEIKNNGNEVKGIVNEAFTIVSPYKKMNESFELTKYRSENCLNMRNTSYNSSYEDFDQYAYVNHGLSFSLEDINLLANDKLDYAYALESLNRLMKVTKYNSSISDDECTFYTANCSSEADISESEVSQDESGLVLQDLNWNPEITNFGVKVFQMIIMLLPPCNRSQLKHLTLLMKEISQNVTLPGLSLLNMFSSLAKSIIRPKSEKEHYDFVTVYRILYFLVLHHDEIFTELPSDTLSLISNDILEHEKKAVTFCKQVTENQFRKQSTDVSYNSLIQLLNHIIDSKEISEKERKKHLKSFKDLYPTIYKSKFPEEPAKPATKGKTMFSFKILRL